MKLFTALLLFLVSGCVLSAQKSGSQNLFSREKSLFIENKGQVTDQNGRLRSDVKFIYTTENYKLVLRENGFSHELLRFEKSQSQKSELEKSRLPEKFKRPEVFNIYSSRID